MSRKRLITISLLSFEAFINFIKSKMAIEILPQRQQSQRQHI